MVDSISMAADNRAAGVILLFLESCGTTVRRQTLN
jgi:hypothetical protein